MNRLYLLGAVGGSFLIGYGLGSYLAKPTPVLNYHTPVTPAKEETDKTDEVSEIVDEVEDDIVLDRTNPVMDRDDDDEERRTPYHTYMDMEEEVEVLPPDPNDPDNPFNHRMGDIEAVSDRDEWLENYTQYKTIHLRSFVGEGIVLDESNMILPRERVRDLVGYWDTATEVTLYNHRLNYRVYLEGITNQTYAEFREEIHHGRSGE